MVITIPESEPLHFYSGETVKWKRTDLADYSAPTWTLYYVLQKTGTRITLNSSQDGSSANHLISLTPSTTRMFQRDWKHAQEKSSVEWNVRVKDLRHFFGSTMLNRGVDSLEIANQMGHQELNMLGERYGYYTDKKLHNSSKVWGYTEKKSQIGANSKSL